MNHFDVSVLLIIWGKCRGCPKNGGGGGVCLVDDRLKAEARRTFFYMKNGLVEHKHHVFEPKARGEYRMRKGTYIPAVTNSNVRSLGRNYNVGVWLRYSLFKSPLQVQLIPARLSFLLLPVPNRIHRFIPSSYEIPSQHNPAGLLELCMHRSR